MDARAARCLCGVYLGSPETSELTRPVAPMLKGHTFCHSAQPQVLCVHRDDGLPNCSASHA